MRKARIALSWLGLLAASAWASDMAQLTEEARYVSKSLPPKLINYIQSSIQQHGVLRTLTNYSHLSPKVLDEAATETGWEIRQISLRNRNPKALPDDWETHTLVEFDKRLASGEPALNIYKSEILTENGLKVFRYMQPIMTQKICLECHGKPAEIKPEVLAKLKEIYPTDAATGYAEGMMRGGLSLRKVIK